MKEDLIKIGLHYHEHTYDLQIPRQISLSQLAKQLPEALAVVGVNLPHNFHLSLMDKAINLAEHQPLADYSIGNSDQFEIIEDKEINNATD
ncbi:type VII secretion protein, YukD family [Lactobacillus sp. PV034]|uniref:type VII secretion protein, YukD family n=1 Tax=Lactobacillus sp. PV034 TaxID=2594495 RepID=UPI00223FCA5B|nr:type VII secretion protein, YukD family [Lactobacillus sp. PV034]QNQ80161.1 type VII secretion protein, YukD family [Lactobacillus sp. PV034]